jgi:hypothetical protein
MDAAKMQRIMKEMRERKKRSLSANMHKDARPTSAMSGHDAKKTQDLGVN